MDQAQNTIIRFLTRRSGLFLNEDKYPKAAAFVSTRMGMIGSDSHDAFLEHIESCQGAGEITRFITAFAVGETSFFRNANHWLAFRNRVLPEIIQAKAGEQRRLRFWSAGCATGEEAYTLAICLWQELEQPRQWEIRIVATDIDRQALAKGREGLYSPYAFRGVNMEALKDHFHSAKDRYRIKQRFRQMVDFSELNLVCEDQYPENLGMFDAIFCRNVLMYFRPEPAQKAVKKIVARLNDGGYLFLGHAEGSLAPRDILSPTACCGTFIYRKTRKGDVAEKTDSPLPGISSGITLPLRSPGAARILKARAEPGGTETIGGDTDATTDPYSEAFDCYVHEDFDRALSILLKDDAKEQKGLGELVLIGLIFFNRSDLRRAETYRRQAHQLSRTSPEVYALEAMIKAAQGDDQGAIRANQNAIFLDKGFFAPNFALAHLHEKRGDAATANRYFTNALKALDIDKQARVKLFYGIMTKRSLARLCKRK
ncbi:MAG: CheR family methyltransferase [Desulfobacteraceae bacterium]|jgi:chemotaxis protein methyltransferase CheR